MKEKNIIIPLIISIFVIVLCSCGESSNSPNDNNVVTSKLKYIINNKDTITVFYDEVGRITKLKGGSFGFADSTNYIYENSKIIISAVGTFINTIDTLYLNSKGLVEFLTASNGNGYLYKENYIYDSEGYLTKILLLNQNSDSVRYTYSGSNLIKREQDTTVLNYEYYLDKLNNFPYYSSPFDGQGILSSPVYGKVSKNLLKKEIHQNGKFDEYRYEFDSKGRIIKTTIYWLKQDTTVESYVYFD